MDKVGRIKIDRVNNIDIYLTACQHGKFNIEIQYRNNDIIIY